MQDTHINKVLEDGSVSDDAIAMKVTLTEVAFIDLVVLAVGEGAPAMELILTMLSTIHPAIVESYLTVHFIYPPQVGVIETPDGMPKILKRDALKLGGGLMLVRGFGL